MSSKEEEEHYKEHVYEEFDTNNSYMPIKEMKTLHVLKKYYHLLYHTTQKGQSFGWNTVVGEFVNSTFLAAAVTYLTVYALPGYLAVHQEGYISDFWMFSFSMYTAIIFGNNVCLCVRAESVTWVFVFYITCLSLAPYFILSYIFDTVWIVENGRQWILFSLGSTLQHYLIVIGFMVLVFIIEESKILYRTYFNPRLIDYLKMLRKDGKADDVKYYLNINDMINIDKNASKKKTGEPIPQNQIQPVDHQPPSKPPLLTTLQDDHLKDDASLLKQSDHRTAESVNLQSQGSFVNSFDDNNVSSRNSLKNIDLKEVQTPVSLGDLPAGPGRTGPGSPGNAEPQGGQAQAQTGQAGPHDQTGPEGGSAPQQPPQSRLGRPSLLRLQHSDSLQPLLHPAEPLHSTPAGPFSNIRSSPMPIKPTLGDHDVEI